MYEDKVRFRAELQSPFSKMNVCVNINELASNRFRKISMQNTENKKDSTGEIQTDEMTEMSEKERRKQRFLFILYFVVIIAIAVFVIYLLCKALFPGLGKLFENGYDEEKVEQFLKHEAGWKGMFALCLLQFIQVISIFIAGAPIQIAGGMIYGFWISFLITHITFVFTNWLVFKKETSKIISGLVLKRCMPAGHCRRKRQHQAGRTCLLPACRSCLPVVSPGAGRARAFASLR